MTTRPPFEVGIFARTFPRPTLGTVLDAVKASGFRLVHFNFACAGLDSIPTDLTPEQCRRIRAEVAARELNMVGVSATFNAIHPDRARRVRETAATLRVIELAHELGTDLVTLCTGTRDPTSNWRFHPGNDKPDAWNDLLHTLEPMVAAAERARVTLGVEPEPGNVVSSARIARRLLDTVASDHVRVVFDAANLVSAPAIPRQRAILSEALGELADAVTIIHAKDVAENGHVAAGRGLLDYDLYAELLKQFRITAPVVLHDVAEDDAPRARRFVEGCLRRAAPAGQ
jgi:sugar phosphate isomerase/epimerase